MGEHCAKTRFNAQFVNVDRLVPRPRIAMGKISLGYTQLMTPRLVKQMEKTKYMATLARRASSLSVVSGLKYWAKVALTQRAQPMPMTEGMRSLRRPIRSRMKMQMVLYIWARAP